MPRRLANDATHFNLTHVRLDPSHCLAPGLFRSLQRGERKRLKLDITYTYGQDSIRFWGPEPLGADDLRVLQGLVAMAATAGDAGRGIILSTDTQSDAGQQLRRVLDLKWDAVEKDAMVAKGSLRELAKELGYSGDGGSRFAMIRECIERLWAVSITVTCDGKRQGFRILSEYASDEKQGRLFVALNPRLAEAVVGERSHIRLEMSEIRALKSDATRLIHQRLCAWINPGRSGRIELDTLCGYAWPTPAIENVMKQRRRVAKNALVELSNLGWKVVAYAYNKYEICRPNSRHNTNQGPVITLTKAPS